MTASIDKVQFRNALAAFTTGVTIVTTRGKDGNDYGLTANSFNSVSLDPPMVLWSLSKTSGNLQGFASAGHFAVHVLAADQEATSNRFAKSGADKFAGIAVERGHGEVPLLDGCSARFQCRTRHLYEGGDHVIVVGEVINFDNFNRPPLAFHGGNYSVLLKKAGKSAATESDPGNDWLGFMLGRAYYQLLLPVRDSLQRKDLKEIDYSILAVLSMGDGRTVGELARIIMFAGQEVTTDDAQRLAARGLVTLDPTRSTRAALHASREMGALHQVGRSFHRVAPKQKSGYRMTNSDSGNCDVALALGAEKMNIPHKAKAMAVFEAGWDVSRADENSQRLSELGDGVDVPPG